MENLKLNKTNFISHSVVKGDSYIAILSFPRCCPVGKKNAESCFFFFFSLGQVKQIRIGSFWKHQNIFCVLKIKLKKV